MHFSTPRDIANKSMANTTITATTRTSTNDTNTATSASVNHSRSVSEQSLCVFAILISA